MEENRHDKQIVCKYCQNINFRKVDDSFYFCLDCHLFFVAMICLNCHKKVDKAFINFLILIIIIIVS